MCGVLKALLELEGNLEVMGEAGTDKKLLMTVAKVIPAVVVVDTEMPDLDGTGATAKIHAVRLQTRMLILTIFGRPGHLCRVLETGASDFMVKDTLSQELVRTVHEVAANGRVIDSELAVESLFEGENPLTSRE